MATEPVPTAFQDNSSFSTILCTTHDLTPTQTAFCDDLIVKLHETLGTSAPPTEEQRQRLWDLVFTGWDSKSPVIHPGGLRGRRVVNFMTQVGIWKDDLPVPVPTTSKKRDRSGSAIGPSKTPIKQTKPERMAGAAAYMKPNEGGNDFGISFDIWDACGAKASYESVAWFDGWTPQRARVEAMSHWDRMEIERVSNYNVQLVVYWARTRLLNLIREQAHIDGNAAGNYSLESASIVENTAELVKPYLWAGKLSGMQDFLDEAKATLKARPVRRKTLTDKA